MRKGRRPDGADTLDLVRWTCIRHRLRPNRYWNATTERTEQIEAGVSQPDGRVMAEPRMDTNRVGNAVAYMADLPLDVSVQFLTVMATKMLSLAVVNFDNWTCRSGCPSKAAVNYLGRVR